MTEPKTSSPEVSQPDRFYLMAVSVRVGRGPIIDQSLEASDEDIKAVYAVLNGDGLADYADEELVPKGILRKNLATIEKAGHQISSAIKEFVESTQGSSFFIVTRNITPDSIDNDTLKNAERINLDYLLSLRL